MKAKFWSNYADKEITAEIIEERKHTVKLRLDSGKVIIKKKKQLI
jgi:hypothetical protein